ncbi:MAG: hypothetical protein J4F28_03000 [Nitrosopumilaceae archaeon]|nr:hypothetical protein [Nitrosopumilaceae archaeon]
MDSDKIYDYPGICASIMEIDPKIRFVGVINDRGRLVAGGMRENVEPLESENDDEMMFMELALRVKMRREFDATLGEVRFALALREKALAISTHLGEDILYVVAEPDADYGALPKRILDIVDA